MQAEQEAAACAEPELTPVTRALLHERGSRLAGLRSRAKGMIRRLTSSRCLHECG